MFAKGVARAGVSLRLLALAAVLVLGLGARHASAADTEGLDLTLHPAGVAWFEENWLVKDGKLTEFVNAYRKEIYALARQTPGYRGYIVWTTMPAEAGDTVTPETFGKTRYKFISPHPSIYLNGTIRTERLANVGAVMGQTYNLRIVHYLQTWKDAAGFQKAMEKLYADAHGGAALSEHLAKTVHPLADNVWTAQFRMVQTGYDPAAYPAKNTAKDAGGLNLEPHAGPLSITEEGWDVRPGQLESFLKAYERDVYSVLRRIKGYRGYTVITTLAPGTGEPKPPMPLGSPEAFTVPYPGMMMNGDVRTDTSINAGSMFRKVYNTKVYHMLDSWESGKTWVADYKKIYQAENNGADPWPMLEKTMFQKVNNHWDFGLRTVEMSFTPK